MTKFEPFDYGKPARIYEGSEIFDEVMDDEDWYLEPKKNGWRAIAHNGKVWSKAGRWIWTVPNLNEYVVLDCEWYDNTLWVFDIINNGQELLTNLSYIERKDELKKIVLPESLVKMPYTNKSKTEAIAMCRDNKDEGVVFKYKKSLYPNGGTYDWLKVRF